MAESRAANSSNSPDAPRPLPARPRPAPGEAVELGDVESDEAMAERLHREERERINARTRDAFYPNQPFDPSPRSTSQAPATPSFVMPTPHGHTTSPIFPHHHPHTSPTYPSAPAPHDTTLGRHMMNGEIARNTGTPRGTWTAPTVHQPNDIPMQPMTESRVRMPRSPYYPETPRGGTNSGWGSPRVAFTGRDVTPHVDDDEAFARALQAQEEEAGGRGAYGHSVSAVDDGDTALAARLQAEEDAGSHLSAGPSSRPPETDDEALARALQEEEDRAGRGGPPSRSALTGPDPGPSGFRAPPGACPGCLRAPSVFEGHITAMGAKWHRDCFKCGSCSKPIGESHFAVREGTPYHRGCYQDRFAPKCGVCCQFIGETGGRRGIAGGSVRFMTHPYWGTVFCPEHELDGTRRCDGCDRMEARGGRGVAASGYGSSSGGDGSGGSTGGEFAELPDGRAMCLECASTAVIDTTHDGQPLYDDVCVFFSNHDMPLLPTRPPLHLVSQDTLNDADDKEGWHVGRTARTRGLCLFEEHTVYTVERTPDFGGGFFPVGFSERVVGQSRGATVVNAVVVLYGLPAVCAGAILAHECTHAYIRMAGGYPRLRPKVEEGLCQLMALLWVENTAARGIETMGVGVGGRNSGGGKGAVAKGPGGGGGWEEHNLAAMAGFVANQIRTDPTEVYGDGLRDALAAYQKHGLASVFANVKQTGELPR